MDKPGNNNKTDIPEQLAVVIDTLALITEQVRAYERVLPADNHQARMAVATLGELAWQALSEVQDLALELTPSSQREHPFTPREHEVLTLVAQGLTNKEIAYRLGLSERTIQFHLNSVFNKTATNSRTEAAIMALQQGWIKLSIGGNNES